MTKCRGVNKILNRYKRGTSLCRTSGKNLFSLQCKEGAVILFSDSSNGTLYFEN